MVEARQPRWYVMMMCMQTVILGFLCQQYSMYLHYNPNQQVITPSIHSSLSRSATCRKGSCKDKHHARRRGESGYSEKATRKEGDRGNRYHYPPGRHDVHECRPAYDASGQTRQSSRKTHRPRTRTPMTLTTCRDNDPLFIHEL